MNFFTYQWQRKCLALLTAIIVWVLVNNSILSQKTIKFVPIRIVNLPVDKTIQGLLPNGFLSKRVSLTLRGTKEVIDKLEPGDLEVILDVSHLPNEAIIQVLKNNLVSLNPNINLTNHIKAVTHPEFMIKMSPMITESIPVTIRKPTGEPPKGYQFLDVWPTTLTQVVSGPQEQVLQLKSKGIDLTFNLDEISAAELDELESERGLNDNEVSFYVPAGWKKIELPVLSNFTELLNDSSADHLHLNFLRKELLPLKSELPVHVFYPLKNSSTINPNTYPLINNRWVVNKNFVPILEVPLLAKDVSKLFLEIVKNNIQLNVVAAAKEERKKLEWGIGFTDEAHLENTYVALLLNHTKGINGLTSNIEELEKHFRKRFRMYMQKIELYLTPTKPLELNCCLQDDHIMIEVQNED